MNILLLNELHKRATKIFESEADWETKYDFIFSPDLSTLVFKECKLDYYDPDSDYEDDVRAFMQAFDEKMEQINKLGLEDE